MRLGGWSFLAANLIAASAATTRAAAVAADGPPAGAFVEVSSGRDLYFQIHSANFDGGEIRGRLEEVGGGASPSAAADAEPSNGTAIPLPPALFAAPVAAAAACVAGRRRRGKSR